MASEVLGERDTKARYRLDRLLGEGATGQVHLAFDVQLRRHVALKSLRSVEPEETYRLKKEFRALGSLSHPNVVQFYDLVVDDEQCFFTMEYVEGQHFLDWVWSGERPNEAVQLSSAARDRLQHGTSQLLQALDALHRAGRVHRDVKPSNILVTDQGRVVLVDLGFATRIDAAQSLKSQIGKVVGTIAYMAPEQALGHPLSTAADLYSVGVILHEALTGRLPHSGTALQMLLSKRSEAAPKVTLSAGAPHGVAQLVEQLLASSPSVRPPTHVVLGQFPEPPPRNSFVREAREFVGRRAELELLDSELARVCDASMRVVHVIGASGLGKTALLERFSATAERARGALVLRARCHQRERVPFKAIDGVIDELSRVLLAMEPSEIAELLPRDPSPLLRLFPVLRRVPALSDGFDVAGLDDRVRHAAFEALRDLLRALSTRGPLVIWIDDLQWADKDGLSFLTLLERGAGAASILLVYTYRPEPREHDRALRAFLKSPPLRALRIQLAPLPLLETGEIVRSVLVRDGGVEPLPDDVKSLAETSGGSPLFARALSAEYITRADGEHEVPVSLQFADLVLARVRRLSDSARLLLHLLCVAGRPLPEHILIRAAGAEDSLAGLHVLHSQALTQYVQVPGGDTAIECSHDGIREAVLAEIERERQIELHVALGAAVAEMPDLAPHQLVDHFLEGADRARAVSYALAAADEAATLCAFDRAASLYERAIALLPPNARDWGVRAKWGQSLANAGYGFQGAEQMLLAADEVEGDPAHGSEAIRLRAAAGQRFIQSGFLDRGLSAMQSALSAVGLRYARTPIVALIWTLVNLPRATLASWWWLLRARKRQRASSERSSLPLQLEIVWAAGVAIGTLDAMRAFEFQVRHALLAFATSNLEHVARAISCRAVVLALQGGERNWLAGMRLQTEAARLAERSDSVTTRALVLCFTSFNAYFMNRWHEARSYSERARRLCREQRAGTVWELTNAQWMTLMASVQLGDIAFARSLLPDLLLEADDRNDLYASACYRLGWPNLIWLCSDEPAEAQRQCEMALAPFKEAKFTTLHMLGMLALANAKLYSGAADAALEAVRHDWGRLARSFQLKLANIGCEMTDLRGRVVLAVLSQGAVDSPKRRRLVKEVEWAIRRLEANPVPSATPRREALRGGLATCLGEAERSVEHLENAVIGFEQLEMKLHAAVVRHRLRALKPDRAARREEDDWMRSTNVARPDRLADVLLPWPSVHREAPLGCAFTDGPARRAP